MRISTLHGQPATCRYSNSGVRPAAHYCPAVANCLPSAGVWASVAPYGTSPTCLNTVPSHIQGIRSTFRRQLATNAKLQLSQSGGLTTPEYPSVGAPCNPLPGHCLVLWIVTGASAHARTCSMSSPGRAGVVMRCYPVPAPCVAPSRPSPSWRQMQTLCIHQLLVSSACGGPTSALGA